MEDQEREFYQGKIVLSEEARRFLGEDLGAYIMERAGEDLMHAVNDFIEVNPHDVKTITGIQVRAKTAMSLPNWINAAIQDGNEALTEYMDRKEMEKEEKLNTEESHD